MVTIEYQHPESFIGFADPDYLSLEIHDSRLHILDFYHISPLAFDGEEIYIKGIFNVYLNTTFLIGVGSSEKLTYSVRIKDRAENWSNTVTSEEITVVE